MDDNNISRLVAAVERIAIAAEQYVASDPLTMLDAALKDQVLDQILDQDGEPMSGPFAEPQQPIASNGMTVIYRHPDPQYQFVARRDATVDGGYSVEVEKA